MSSRRLLVLFAVLVVAAASLPASAQVITKVERRNPVTASADTAVVLAPNPLAEKSPAMVDRVHLYVSVPPALLGTQYVEVANDDKNNANYELHLTIGQPGTLYLFIDNRLGTGTGGQTAVPNLTAGGMPWVIPMGFVDTGMDIGIDEAADGTLNNWYSVFSKQVAPGEVVLNGQNDPTGSRNMYGVAASAPKLKASKPIPADGEQGVTLPLLQWTPGGTAVLHNVYLGTSPQLGQADLVAPKTGNPAFYYALGLTPGTTYYWRVDEIEGDLTTIHTGDVWSFNAASSTAFNPVPADGARWVDPNTVLSWKAGKDGVSHAVYFGTDKAGVESGAASAFQTTIYLTSWTPPALKPDTTYFWRIDEVAGNGTKKTGQVWSFATIQTIAINDPNLLGWWKMDEGVGTTAVDWSGHGRHLRFATPAPTWATGLFGGALQFAGNGDSAVCANGSFLNGLTALTVTVWVKSDVTNTDRGFLIFETPASNDNMDMRYDAAGGTGGGTNVMKMGLTVSVSGTNTVLQLESANNSQSTDWQFLTMVWSSGQPLAFYINGVLDSPTANSAAVVGTLVNCSAVIIGKAGKDNTGSSSWDGLIDEVCLYNKALTPQEIQTAMRGDPLLAWNPSPANGATTDAVQVTPLTWNAGDKATKHDVYLGTDQAAVGAATVSDTTGLYRGRLSGASFTPDPELATGLKYFWRVDEVNSDGTISPGFVWSFLLVDYLIVDDFESYNDTDNVIFDTWLDNFGDDSGSLVGNDAPPYAEQRPAYVHSGRQSLSMVYNNAGPKHFFSETVRTFDTTRNWTDKGMTDLLLYVQGAAIKFAEPAPGAITMSGAGTDIFNTADQGRLAWKRLTGNGTIIAKVESLDNTNEWAKAGVMIRESLDAGSRFAGVYISPGHGAHFQARAMTDLAATSDSTVSTTAQNAALAPAWVKLERIGNDFNASYSTDGTTWTAMSWNPQTINMTGSIYVGVVVTSHNATAVCTAQFSNITITGGVSGQWQTTDIGVAQPGNSQDDLYVAVQDSAGKIAVVTNPNPAAVNATAWTEWKIPLSSLTGVNLTKVKKLYLGVGDRNNPSADGSGKLYIDDIRLVKTP
jgi:regulation of enolase protein 1 (concanavalin A-like superfamily)